MRFIKHFFTQLDQADETEEAYNTSDDILEQLVIRPSYSSDRIDKNSSYLRDYGVDRNVNFTPGHA